MSEEELTPEELEQLEEIAEQLEGLKDRFSEFERSRTRYNDEFWASLSRIESRLMAHGWLAEQSVDRRRSHRGELDRFSQLIVDKALYQRTSQQLAVTLTGTKEVAEDYRNQCDALLTAMYRYNPEVVNRQEELHELAQVAERYNPAVGIHAKKPGNLRDNLRQELSYLVPLNPVKKTDGAAKLREFQTWITGRAVIPAALEDAGGVAVVSNDNRLTFNLADAHLCQEPILLIHDRLLWCTLPEQHGLLVCPEFQYGPTPAYSGDTWTKVAEHRACAEQKREVFYERDGRVQYAGTYVCHSGPSGLQLGELRKMKSEILVRALAKETRKAKKQKKAPRELVTIEQLYREGVLTVHVLGLERVGFNRALYTRLAARCAPYVPAPLVHCLPPRPPAAVPVAPVVAPRPQLVITYMDGTPYYPPAAAPVAGPSRLPYAPVPAPPAPPPVASALLPPPSYIANIPINTKRAREDCGGERFAKYARLSMPEDYSRSDDEGYLFYQGENYYKDMFDDDLVEYEGEDAVSLGGDEGGYSDEYDEE